MNDFLKLAGEIMYEGLKAMNKAKYRELQEKIEKGKKLDAGEKFLIQQLIREKIEKLEKMR